MKNINELNQLLLISKALGNPIRLEILSLLTKGGLYVSEIARQLGINRTLLYLHLTKLEEAGFIFGELRISSDGKALKYYHLSDFSILIDNQLLISLTKITDKEN